MSTGARAPGPAARLAARELAPRPPRRLLIALSATLVLALVTVAMLAVRPMLKEVHVALILLLVVLGASAAGGRALGLWMAAISFVVFDVLFLPPYNTLIVANPLDWLVLVAFLATSVVAAQLLYRAQEEARLARERAAEIDRLATLGAEAINVARATHALLAVADVIRTTTGADVCEIYVHASLLSHDAPAGRLALAARSGNPVPPGTDRGSLSIERWVVERGDAAVERRDGTTHLTGPRPSESELEPLSSGDELALLLPLHVGARVVGVLRIASAAGLRLDLERWRFLDAISYYAALGVERARLEAEAERAQALREADRLKDALIASVSHDLRTPLTTIKALAHDLGELGDERTVIIEQEADRLNRFVADLLDLSRLSAGALPMKVELNAIDDLLGALVQRTEASLEPKPLVVTLSPDDALLVGRFDLVHALRILVNLVENAGKYDRSPAPVEVHAERLGGEIAVSVADRGPGVPPAELGRIFEPFYRRPGSAPDVGGAGLGLSIAHGLAEAQGARVTYQPRAGGGSVFTLFLPYAEPAAPAAMPVEASAR